MRTFNKHKEKLREHDGDIWSYTTKVATIVGDTLVVPKWHSVTTSRHINYAADQLGLQVVKEYE